MNVTDGKGEGAAARTDRIGREFAAAKRFLATGDSEVDEVLSAVAARLAREIGKATGAVEETAPASALPVATTR